MNGQQYFEENPWNRACALIAQQELGPVHQVIAQCVCPAGTLQAALEQWKERIVGFVFGVLTSVAASLIIKLVTEYIIQLGIR